MPVYGPGAQGMAELVQAPMNAFYRAQDRQQVLGQRDEELRQRSEARNALMQQNQQEQATQVSQQQLMEKWSEIRQYVDEPPEIKAQYFQDQAQQYPGFAQTRIGKIAQQDPVQAFDMAYRGLAAKMGVKIDEPQAPKRDIRNVGGSLLEIPAEGDPRVLYREPQQPREPREPPRPQLVNVTLPDGTVQQKWLRPGETQGAPVGAPTKPATPAGDKLTESDKRIGVLFRSVLDAEDTIAGLGDGTTTASRWNALLNAVPFDGGASATLQSDAFRKYEAAALRWAANALYIKSGATAPPEEVRSTYKQFFPQPGDGAEVIEQKALAREQEIQNFRDQYPHLSSVASKLPKQKATPPAGTPIKHASGATYTIEE